MADTLEALTRPAAPSARPGRATRPPRRRSPRAVGTALWPIVAATLVASVAVVVGERFEPRPPTDHDGVASDATVAAGPVAAPPELASGGLTLAWTDGAATIATERATPVVFATRRIGDRSVGPGELVRDGTQISHAWNGATEWYRAIEGGFEHGYTIDNPMSDGDLLSVEVEIAGGTPELVGADVSIARAGAAPLSYRGLHVVDADGAVLPSHLAVEGATIAIEVAVDGATYPITIDPIIAEDVRVDPVLATEPSSNSGQINATATGGAFTEANCRSGDALTGLRVYRADFGNRHIRAAQLICTPLATTSTTFALSTANTYDGATFGDPTYGEGPTTTQCATGSVVTALRGRYGALVDAVQLECSPLLADGTLGAPVALAEVGNTDQVTRTEWLPCTGGWASGLTGRTGQDTDRVGLSCQVAGTTDDDRFGWAIDVDGNRMVVGAPGDDRWDDDAGAVYVYDRPSADAAWVLDAVLTLPVPPDDPNYHPWYSYGTAVAVRGDQIAVGDPDNFERGEPGRVWLYTRAGPGDWGVPERIDSASSFVDGFGTSVDFVAADRLVIGAPFDRGDPGRIYEYATGVLTDITAPAHLDLSEPDDEHGFAVAVDELPGGAGFRLVVGAPGHGSDGGAIDIYEDSGSGFEWKRRFSGFVPAGTRYGTAVDVDGDRIAYGGHGDGATGATMVAFVSETTDGGANWSEQALVNAALTDSFRQIVDGTETLFPNDYLALEGGTFAVGGLGTGGGVRLVRHDGTGWSGPTDELRPGGIGSGDLVGWGVEIDGTTVVAGAPGDDGTADATTDAGAGFSFDATLPPVPPGLSFDLELAPDASPSVAVAPSGIAVNRFNASTLESVADDATTVAASSIASIELEDTPLTAVEIGATPLTAVVLESEVLSNIALINIDVDGGWETLVAGSGLEDEPLANLTFGDALGDPVVKSRVEALPLTAVDVEGTPLTAVSLTAVALGNTPLTAVPLTAVGGGTSTDGWCTVIGDLLDEYPNCQEALADLTLMEITLRGVPLTAVPLTAVPLTAVDLSQAPLTAVGVADADLLASPLTAVPLTAVPLTAVGAVASPLTAVPLTAVGPESVPLTAVPLTAVEFGGQTLDQLPLTYQNGAGTQFASLPVAVPLTAVPLTAVDATGAPLTRIQLQRAPLTAVPLTAVVLANTRLSDIPLTAVGGDNTGAWCDVIAASGAKGITCDASFVSQTTLRELAVRGVPLTAVPLTAVPLTAVDLQGAPLTAVPLTAVPLTAISATSIPLTAVTVGGTTLDQIAVRDADVAGSPLTAVPLTAVQIAGTPLTAVTIAQLPLTAVPLTAVGPAGTPLTAVEVNGVPLTAVPLTAVDVLGSPLTAVPLTAVDPSLVDCTKVECRTGTLGDAVRKGALAPGVTFGDLQSALGGLSFGDVAGAFAGFDAAALRGALDGLGLTLGQLSDLGGMTLGDLPENLPAVQNLLIGQLALSTITLGDIAAALSLPGAAAAIRASVDAYRNAAGAGATIGDLDNLGDVTLGDLLQGGPPITLGQIEPLLGFISVQAMSEFLGITIEIPAHLTLGDLSPEQLGQLTLGDLVGKNIAQFDDATLGELIAHIDAALSGFTLVDLLLALVDPASLPFGGFRFEAVDVDALPPGTVPAVGFEASFTLTGSSARTVEVSTTLPSNASYVRGSATVTAAGGLPAAAIERDPVVAGRRVTWTIDAMPDLEYTIDFDVLPSVRLGPASIAAVATIVGTDISVPAGASVTVAEGLEPNDFVDGTTPAGDNVIFLTYVATPDDVDVFEFTVEENDRVLAELSNLDADLDMALYGRPDDAAVGDALSRAGDQPPLIPIRDPDADGADAEPLDDFVRLDQIDPTLELLQVSNRTGTANEVFATDRLPAGTYFIQVFGPNGATNVSPAALQLKIRKAEARPQCVALGPLPAATPGPATDLGAATGNTLILVNEMRFEQLHGAAARASVADALGRLTGFLANNPQLEIEPIVVPVDGFPAVRAAYDAWDAPPSAEDACDPERANAVVGAINSEIVDPLRDQLDHVVILGGDELIPMARLIDGTVVANEYDFRHQFDGMLNGPIADGANAFTSAFWESRYLSDEPYGETAARSLGERFLYVSDVALGRVVETPAEIVDALDTFVRYGGALDVSSGTVLGYDFLSDGSEEIATTLRAALPAGSVDDTYADGTGPGGDLWTEQTAKEALQAAGSNALVSLNAHFDHYRALPAIGDHVPGFDDNLIADEVAALLGDDALDRSLIFSMGCHSALSVSDVLIGATNGDWAQDVGRLGALYVGNTGFGYGDTVSVAYSERLMSLFAQRATEPLDLPGALTATTTIGQALTYAKNQYVGELQVFSVYDEKAVMESTFYGLPFYRVGLTPVAPPVVPDNTTSPDATGTASLRVQLDATNDAHVVSGVGTYYSNPAPDGGELTIVAPGRPIQPKVTVDVSVVDPADSTELAQVARGAMVLGMTSTWVPLADPVIATPVFDEIASAPEPAVGDTVFPAKPLSINTVTEPGGTRQRLVAATGQYRADAQTQRLDDDLDVVVYYSEPDATDTTPPTIGTVTATLVAGSLTVNVTVSDAASTVDRVHVLVAADPGVGPVVWRGLDLRPSSTAGRWTGTLALGSSVADARFIVQAKDGLGNVGVATNRARNFNPTPAPAPVGGLAAEALPDNLAANGSGWYVGPATVRVTTGEPATYSVTPGVVLPLPASGEFTITADGVTTWTVTTASGRVAAGQVRIDTDGAPDIVFGTPVDGGVHLLGGRFDVRCVDVSGASCELALGDGTVVADGDPLPAPGAHVLHVTATDATGQTAQASVSFTVVGGPPVITSITGPAKPQVYTDPVTVTARFTDPSTPHDAHTATIDWGDGTTPATVTEPTAAAEGTVTGTHVYGKPGVYAVTVTLADAEGFATSKSYEFVVVFDPAAGVSGSGTYWSESAATGPRGNGKGNDVHFGYSARYKSGDVYPSGTTRIRLKDEIRFESTSYDYLIISGTMATAEGTGRLNGVDYRFRVHGVDNGSVDYFEIVIWDADTNAVVYDNGVLYEDDTAVLLGGIRIKS